MSNMYSVGTCVNVLDNLQTYNKNVIKSLENIMLRVHVLYYVHISGTFF